MKLKLNFISSTKPKICPKEHKLVKTSQSACDDIYICKCGKWLKYCLNGSLTKL